MNPVAIAQQWNQGGVSAAELQGTPLSKEERAYAEGRTFSLSIILKDGCKKFMRIDANRGIDAFIEMVTTAEEEGWVDDMKNIDIVDVTGNFE